MQQAIKFFTRPSSSRTFVTFFLITLFVITAYSMVLSPNWLLSGEKSVIPEEKEWSPQDNTFYGEGDELSPLAPAHTGSGSTVDIPSIDEESDPALDYGVESPGTTVDPEDTEDDSDYLTAPEVLVEVWDGNPNSPVAFLHNSSGVYKDMDKWEAGGWRLNGLRKHTLHNTVFMSSCNYGHADFAVNFLCTAHLDLSSTAPPYKHLLVAQDLQALNFLRTLSVNTMDGSAIGLSAADGTEAGFRTQAFNNIVQAKVKAALWALKSGRNVFFSDVDIGFLDDPVKYLHNDIDFQAQPNFYKNEMNYGDELNTGFYFLKATHKTIRLLEEVLLACEKDPTVDDQTHWATVLRKWWLIEGWASYSGTPASPVNIPVIYHPLTFVNLDVMQFPPGLVYVWNHEKYKEAARILGKPEKPVIAHVNFMAGHFQKKNGLKALGLWNLDDEKFALWQERWNHGVDVLDGDERVQGEEIWKRLCKKGPPLNLTDYQDSPMTSHEDEGLKALAAEIASAKGVDLNE